jgi:hypothetical protein
LCAAALARFAALRFVLETFVRKEHLLASREDKFRSTVGALQNLIVIFHTLLRDPAGRRQATVQSIPEASGSR